MYNNEAQVLEMKVTVKAKFQQQKRDVQVLQAHWGPSGGHARDVPGLKKQVVPFASLPDSTTLLWPRTEDREGGLRGDEVNWGEKVPFDKSGLDDPEINSLSLSWRSTRFTWVKDAFLFSNFSWSLAGDAVR